MKFTNNTTTEQLPSEAQLAKSTIKAFAVAMILLVTIILPAEYAVDPTGVGNLLGLKRMGEIKVQLAEEAQVNAEEATMKVEKNENESMAEINEPAAVATPVIENDIKKEVITRTVSPDQGFEIKALMDSGKTVEYTWTASGSGLNYDAHGENNFGDFKSYSKGVSETEKSGTIKAPFDGEHGWFWRNRTSAPIQLSLEVSGEFDSLKEY